MYLNTGEDGDVAKINSLTITWDVFESDKGGTGESHIAFNYNMGCI